MRDAVARTGLDRSGMTILTEAATGAYGVTAPIAALAGAKQVLALARPSPYGSVREAADWTKPLAASSGVGSAVRVVEELPDNLRPIDLITNSSHLRPINARMIHQLGENCVIALMFEAWEFRPQDIDLALCREKKSKSSALTSATRPSTFFRI